jgi:hypothetical protein
MLYPITLRLFLVMLYPPPILRASKQPPPPPPPLVAAQAGGGRYPEGPSPPTNRAAARFLERRTGLPPAALEAAERRGVGPTLRALTALQVQPKPGFIGNSVSESKTQIPNILPVFVHGPWSGVGPGC